MSDYDFAKDPIFSQFTPWEGRADAGFDLNFVGQRTDVTFNAGWADEERMKDRYAWPPYPALGEETFEWINLLSAILEAKDKFNMIELGAGYGRWVISAACALRRTRANLPFKLMAVEGDPTHYGWMIKHFADNGINRQDHRLINAAVSDKDGEVIFTKADDPSLHYGQLIVDRAEYAERFGHKAAPNTRCFALATLLKEFDIVDVIDMDIQGAELSVVSACPAELSAKVRRVHIGTHGVELESGLRTFFRGLGWSCQWDFGTQGVRDTPYGSVRFEDGAQTWINPRLT